jgi:hypothetical protein
LQAAEKVDGAFGFLGGAALQRCGKCNILTAALAAEVRFVKPARECGKLRELT